MSQQRDKVANLVSRGEISLVDSTGKMQRVQGSILAHEVKTGMEHFEPYGFTSNPFPGAEFVPIFLEGDRSHGITLVCADRRYRIRGLPTGSIALGVPGNSIIIGSDGTMAVETTALSIVAETIASEGEWTHTGILTASDDVVAGSVSLVDHVHFGVTAGSEESGPPVGGGGGGGGGSGGSGFADGDGAALVSYWSGL